MQFERLENFIVRISFGWKQTMMVVSIDSNRQTVFDFILQKHVNQIGAISTGDAFDFRFAIQTLQREQLLVDLVADERPFQNAFQFGLVLCGHWNRCNAESFDVRWAYSDPSNGWNSQGVGGVGHCLE